MRIAIITVFLSITVFNFLLKYLNYSRRNAPIPENVRDVYDEDAYKKYLAYSMNRTVYSIISGTVGAVITLLFLLFNVHFKLYEFISQHIQNTILTGLFILFVPLFVESVIGTLMGIYDTFVIEAKHGFNKTKPLTYIGDFFKSIVVGAVIGGGLLALFYMLYDRLGDMVFIAFFFVMIIFIALAGFLSPLFIRIFNKLTPLEDGELKEKITALAEKTGCSLKGIYTVDASKRSTKSNAFATGFGKTKTIGLYDTLLDKFTDDEI